LMWIWLVLVILRRVMCHNMLTWTQMLTFSY
jgi:hypothetical protein